MACSQQNNQRYRNIETVRALAQMSADMLQVDMRIYKTICDGVQIFKFSESWSGQILETIRFNRKDTSSNVLHDNEDWRNLVTKSTKSESSKKRTRGNME